MIDIYGKPEYYRVIKHYKLPKVLFNLPLDLVVIHFANRDLSDPDTDPICVYHYAGTRKYLWNNKVWNEYCVNWSTLESLALDFLDRFSNVDDREFKKVEKQITICRNVIDTVYDRRFRTTPIISCDNEPALFIRSILEVNEP